MDNFFVYKTRNKIAIKIKYPEVDMGIIKRLGKPKFWVSNNDFNEIMKTVYKTASKYAKEKYESLMDKKEA